MIIPTPRTWGVESITAAKLQEISDALTFLLNQPKGLAYRAAALTAVNGVVTVIGLDAEITDNDNMHSTVTNNSRVTFTTSGTYIVVGSVSYGANTAGKRTCTVRTNAAGSSTGGSFLVDNTENAPTGPSTVPSVLVSIIQRFNAGDYIEMFYYQDSGGTLGISVGSVQTYLQAHRLSNFT